MFIKEENVRFWLPVLVMAVFAFYCGYRLLQAHLNPSVSALSYTFERDLQARRGSIYSASGKGYPLVKSVPYWEYRLDPGALDEEVKKWKRKKATANRTKDDVVKTISEALGIDYGKVRKMANVKSGNGWRSQYLAMSSDPDVHRTLINRKLVAGIAVIDKPVREYLYGRLMSHVLGSINYNHEGSSGLEIKYERQMIGTPGKVQGMKDAHGRELYDRRIISIDPIDGDSLFLTLDHNMQFEAEDALKWGMREFGAPSGWCIVMDANTGAILAMASQPDFEPIAFGRATDSQKMNRAIGFNYEPGSVMKVITAAAAIDSNPKKYGPMTRFSTNRNDPNYYKLPGDGSHKWESTMTLKEAIVHSSNIVIGKLGYDLGPKKPWNYMRAFGFGSRTGIDLPGEQYGILRNWAKWDKGTWSRAAIGQGVSVTALQLASAYQSIANDGIRMQPYVVERIERADGTETYRHQPKTLGRSVSATTARTIKQMMLDVASPNGTARKAAIRGYSVAGKTGTAQKAVNGHYADGLYRATFCGIVPASEPRFVILTTLDFESKTRNHQGGNSAGPVFKRLAMAALRYYSVPPDRPEELEEYLDDDEFDRVLEERAKKYGIMSSQ